MSEDEARRDEEGGDLLRHRLAVGLSRIILASLDVKADFKLRH